MNKKGLNAWLTSFSSTLVYGLADGWCVPLGWFLLSFK
jgi:hypothetical protein